LWGAKKINHGDVRNLENKTVATGGRGWYQKEHASGAVGLKKISPFSRKGRRWWHARAGCEGKKTKMGVNATKKRGNVSPWPGLLSIESEAGPEKSGSRRRVRRNGDPENTKFGSLATSMGV